MDTLKALAESCMKAAKDKVASGGEVMPALTFFSPKGLGFIGVPDYGNKDAKSGLLVVMRDILKEQGAELYAFTMEAWVGIKEKHPGPGYLPSKDPERQEGIIVSAADNAGNTLVLCAKIHRTEPVTFSEVTDLSIGGGALLELLQEPATKTVH